MSDLRSQLAVTRCDNLSLASVLLRRGTAEAVSRALREYRGITLPLPGRLASSDGLLLLWSGPDRFLAVREGGSEGLLSELAPIFDGMGYVVEASSSRSVLQVAGCGAAEALNRLLPIDLHPLVFTPGSVALTTAGHVAVQIWRTGDEPVFQLACGASFAEGFRRQVASACFGDVEQAE